MSMRLRVDETEQNCFRVHDHASHKAWWVERDFSPVHKGFDYHIHNFQGRGVDPGGTLGRNIVVAVEEKFPLSADLGRLTPFLWKLFAG